MARRYMLDTPTRYSKARYKWIARRLFYRGIHTLVQTLPYQICVLLLCLLFVLYSSSQGHITISNASMYSAHRHRHIALLAEPKRDVERGSIATVLASQQQSIRLASYPAYLPLAQYLKQVGARRYSGPSLRDMAYGTQRATQSDLIETDNADLFKQCPQCDDENRMVTENIQSKEHQQVALALLKVIDHYNISSLLQVPCAEHVTWMPSVMKIVQTYNRDFTNYCLVRSDSEAISMSKSYTHNGVVSAKIISSLPLLQHQRLPRADLMLSWEGLEKHSLDEIENAFKEVVDARIPYVLVGSKPGVANAKLEKTAEGAFMIRMPETRVLNVRGFPFGFNKAMHVINISLRKQLLMFKSAEMRDAWDQ